MLTVSNKNSLYDDTWNGYVCVRHLVVSLWTQLGFIEIDERYRDIFERVTLNFGTIAKSVANIFEFSNQSKSL